MKLRKKKTDDIQLLTEAAIGSLLTFKNMFYCCDIERIQDECTMSVSVLAGLDLA